jgi:hypothetical protein
MTEVTEIKVTKVAWTYVPRLNVELTEEQDEKINKLLPWGVRKAVVHRVLDALFALLEKDSPTVVGAILSAGVDIKLEVKESGQPS